MFRTSIVVTLMSWLILVASQSAGAQTIHLVLAGDSGNEALRMSVGVSQSSLKTAIQNTVPKEFLRIYEHPDSDNVSGKWLLDTLKELAPESNDTVIVYYLGHGGYDVEKKVHILRYANQPVTRQDVMKALPKLNSVRLRMLITDSCASVVTTTAAALDSPREVNAIPVGVRRLFFESKGELNINSCDWGQVALATYRNDGDTNLHGGAFTHEFSKLIKANKDSSTVTWRSFVTEVSDSTRIQFKKILPNGKKVTSLTGETVTQTTQDPVVIGTYPDIPSDPTAVRRYILGVNILILDFGQGVEVQSVNPGTAATRMKKRGDATGQNWYLQAADVILQVGGMAVDDVPDMYRALTLPGPATWLKVKDGTTGNVADYEVILDKSN